MKITVNIAQLESLIKMSSIWDNGDDRGSIEISLGVLRSQGHDADDGIVIEWDRAWKNTPRFADGGVWYLADDLEVTDTHQAVRLLVMKATGGIEKHHYYVSHEYSTSADLA